MENHIVKQEFFNQIRKLSKPSEFIPYIASIATVKEYAYKSFITLLRIGVSIEITFSLISQMEDVQNQYPGVPYDVISDLVISTAIKSK